MLKNIINKIEQISERKTSLFIFLFTFALRVLFVVFSFLYNVMDSFADDKGYFYLAKEIVQRGKVFYDTNIHLYAEMLGPGLPWINALTISLFGDHWLPIFIVSAGFSALITFLTYKTARLFLEKTPSLFAGIWSSFYFFYYDFSATAGKEIYLSFFFISILYLLIKIFIN